MKQQKETVTLTVAQAIIKYLSSQYIEIEGEKVRLCGGGFGIFGHGNVTCLGEALFENKEKLPLYRGQNEQGMGFAAAGYAKAYLRRRFMFCTASAGPGTANLLTSAALAHANRLPMLMLCGDTFITRLPDPVLQQLEPAPTQPFFLERYAEAYRAEMIHFVDVVNSGGIMKPDGEDGLRAQLLADAADEAARDGKSRNLT